MKRNQAVALKEQQRERIASLYVQGASNAEIARQVGLSARTVYRDIETVRDHWRESAIRDFDAAKARELAKIDEAERNYWIGWNRSLKDREKVATELDGGEQVKQVKKLIEGQSGDPRMLDGVLKCVEQRSKILGLHAPEKFQNLTPPAIVNVLVESHEDHVTFQRFQDSVVGKN